jgi:F-type H+-transporting ATPase subunit epsilon
MGIYPQHIPLMTQIVAGEVIVRKGGQDSLVAVSDGFAEIAGDHVAILADLAIKAENIDEAKAEEARQRAQARLAEQIDAEEVTTVEASLAYSLAQLKVKRRHRP